MSHDSCPFLVCELFSFLICLSNLIQASPLIGSLIFGLAVVNKKSWCCLDPGVVGVGVGIGMTDFSPGLILVITEDICLKLGT